MKHEVIVSAKTIEAAVAEGAEKPRATENFVDVADDTDGFFGETGAFETDNIDHFDPAVASFGSHKGRNVF